MSDKIEIDSKMSDKIEINSKMSDKIERKSELSTKTVPGWLKFVFGGSAGMMATSIVQPMDLLKTRMQLLGPAGRGASAIGVAASILKDEGFRGFYRGMSAAAFRQATYASGRLGMFTFLFDWYKEKYSTPNLGTKLVIGMIAGGIGSFIGNPAEVCVIRMTADGRLPMDQRRNYRHAGNAVMRIIREEGAMTLMRGVRVTVGRAMIVNAAQLGTYSQAREMLLPPLGDGMPLHLCASMISGLVTTLVSQPMDIVKTRLQNAEVLRSPITIFTEVIKKEGVLALWRGSLPTYAKIGPHTVLTFIFLEQINAFYLKV